MKTQELTDEWIDDTDEHITEGAVQNSSAKLLPEQTILLALYGATVGQLGILRRAMTCNQACCAMVADPVKADFRYLYYQLLHARPLLKNLAVGAAQQNLSGLLMKSFELPFPHPAEQRAIAGVLGALDDKIELNRRMNETLEAIAKAEFRRMMEEGGEEVPFADTVDILGGGTPKTSVADYWNGEIPWFSVVDAPSESDVFVIDTEKKITQAGVENSSTQVLPVGTTIISARGTVGKVALVGMPMAMNQSCYGLRGKADEFGYYTYFQTRAVVGELQQHAHGSVFDTITRDTLAGVDVPAPEPATVTNFEKKVAPLMKRILNNLQESRTLAALRDALLPKLLSGAVRVRT